MKDVEHFHMCMSFVFGCRSQTTKRFKKNWFQIAHHWNEKNAWTVFRETHKFCTQRTIFSSAQLFLVTAADLLENNHFALFCVAEWILKKTMHAPTKGSKPLTMSNMWSKHKPNETVCLMFVSRFKFEGAALHFVVLALCLLVLSVCHLSFLWLQWQTNFSQHSQSHVLGSRWGWMSQNQMNSHRSGNTRFPLWFACNLMSVWEHSSYKWLSHFLVTQTCV